MASGRVHGVPNHPTPSYMTVQCAFPPTAHMGYPPTVTISSSPGAAPLPTITISPLPGVSPLPAVFTVGVQNPHNLPSPTIPAPVPTTLSVNPLVDLDSGLRNHKVQYDASTDPINIRISNLYGPSTPITDEQKYSLAVEGPLHGRLHVVFDHPALIHTIDFEGSPTVLELFMGIHSYLHERVEPEEEPNLKGMGLHQTATKAQSKRCEAALDTLAEWNRGMKRVDILGKERKFCGIYLDSSTFSDYLALRVVFKK